MLIAINLYRTLEIQRRRRASFVMVTAHVGRDGQMVSQDIYLGKLISSVRLNVKEYCTEASKI